MLTWLRLAGVGPADKMRADFAPRINVITGDNGLGKSFLLDVAWWALTRTWAGQRAIPTRNEQVATISYSVRDDENAEKAVRSPFHFKTQTWPLFGRHLSPTGVVIYARLDGGFSVWDSARNGQKGEDVERADAHHFDPKDAEHPNAYHFDQAAVFDGLAIHGKSACEGLERDWVSWQRAGAPEFAALKKALLSLSAPDEPIEPAAPRRVFVGEARDRPAIRVGGQEVPIVLASAGVRRVLAVAYLLVWAWREYWLEAELQRLGEPERRLVLLFDEPETHLHPRWQRTILPAVLRAADGLRSEGAETQVIAATHSPLVLASLEPLFDAERDGWLDLDLVGAGDERRVELKQRPFVRRGDVSAWLESEAFDSERGPLTGGRKRHPGGQRARARGVAREERHRARRSNAPRGARRRRPLLGQVVRVPRRAREIAQSGQEVIPVKPAPKPKGFDAKVRRPGLCAIAEMVGKTPPYARTGGRAFKQIADRERDIPAERFPPYWTESLDDLMAAYHEVCAYACIRIHPVTGAKSADHFAPKSRNWRQVYRWSNYRLCCSRMNAKKRDFGDVLDPFTIQPGWFQLDLLNFEVIPNPSLTRAAGKKIQDTIDRLELNDFKRAREEHAADYWRREISLRTLKRESPFVATELHRQGRLNPGDVW